jgi:hypothetical protein
VLTLPLLNHALELVIQDEDFDTNLELRGSGELHRGHAERRIAIDVNDSLVWCSNFGADSGR